MLGPLNELTAQAIGFIRQSINITKHLDGCDIITDGPLDNRLLNTAKAHLKDAEEALVIYWETLENEE